MAIVNANNVPVSILGPLSTLCLSLAVSESNDPSVSGARSILSAIHQRHPTILRDSADKLRSTLGDAVVNSAIAIATLPAGADMFLAAENAEATVRASGVQDLVAGLKAGTIVNKVRIVNSNARP